MMKSQTVIAMLMWMFDSWIYELAFQFRTGFTRKIRTQQVLNLTIPHGLIYAFRYYCIKVNDR